MTFSLPLFHPFRVFPLSRAAAQGFLRGAPAAFVLAGALAASPVAAQSVDSPNLPAPGATDPRPASAGTAAPAALGGGLRPPAKYLLPAFATVRFDTLLSRFDGAFAGFNRHVTSESVRRNLHGGREEDRATSRTSELGHPYQGPVSSTLARSAGLGYRTSAAYTFAGGAFRESADETTRPSRNDRGSSGIAGSFLGEALYRMSHLLLERGGFLPPGWRETAAVSPATGFNRLAFDKRLDADLSSRNAAFSRFRADLIGTVQDQSGLTTSLPRNLAAIDYSLD